LYGRGALTVIAHQVANHSVKLQQEFPNPCYKQEQHYGNSIVIEQYTWDTEAGKQLSWAATDV